ncbi:MAG TPA: LacI family transcriptional regulator [Clostridiales bacterium]|nr:LacI family transcriptional regulator [Clostridiales bacterium]
MVTIKDVAKKAGVSSSTVSRALSGKIPVDEKTKERVLAAVKELNYQPNALAKGLKEGVTGTIGLIVPNICNPVFPLVSRGVEDTARKHGYTLILCNTDEDINIEKECIQKLRKQWVDGIILAASGRDDSHINELKASGLPMVLLIRKLGDEVDAVVIDNKKAAYQAVRYLVDTGHQRIIAVIGDTTLPLYSERFQGYCQALEEAGIVPDPSLVIKVPDNESCYDAIYRLIKKGVKADAVFALSDPRALEAMRAVKDAGLRIPQDISVVGIDNLQFTPFLDPPLTTVSQPLYQMGEAAAERLISIIKGDKSPPYINVMETRLIIRKSVECRTSNKIMQL